MCEFCHEHGEGKKWYLQAKNYSEDLLNDLNRRKSISDIYDDADNVKNGLKTLAQFKRLPSFVAAAITPILIYRQKRSHFGQVVPIEDIERIFSFVNSVVRYPCICRQSLTGTEQRYCYGLSMVPPEESQYAKILRSLNADYLTGPHTSGLEALSKEVALHDLRLLEQKGLCHTVWTYLTPFIGGICNCDRADCVGMLTTITNKFPMMFRAEYVAQIDGDQCNGCRQCMHACQFGAMGYGIAQKKVIIDPRLCYGCGICRAYCEKDAITLVARSSVPLAARLW